MITPATENIEPCIVNWPYFRTLLTLDFLSRRYFVNVLEARSSLSWVLSSGSPTLNVVVVLAWSGSRTKSIVSSSPIEIVSFNPLENEAVLSYLN